MFKTIVIAIAGQINKSFAFLCIRKHFYVQSSKYYVHSQGYTVMVHVHKHITSMFLILQMFRFTTINILLQVFKDIKFFSYFRKH